MFATELIQSLITHYNNENGMDNCYILDETQDINKDILKNSQNIVIFRHSLITEQDLAKIKRATPKWTTLECLIHMTKTNKFQFYQLF